MRPSLITLFLPAFLASCLPLTAASSPARVGPTVTPDPSATASLTPFVPLAASPTSLPSLPAAALPTPLVSQTAVPGPLPAESPNVYVLTAVLDYAAHTLEVQEEIYYRNSSGSLLPDLVLAVEPNHWTDCFSLEALLVNDQGVVNAELDGHRLGLPLAEPLAPGGELRLSLRYRLSLPAATSSRLFGYYSNQLNLVDWYPFIVPYDPAQGWLLHPPGNGGEHLVYDQNAFDVTLLLSPSGWVPTVAASAPGNPVEGGWHYLLPAGRTFALSASPYYATQELTVEGLRLTGYYFQSDQAPARQLLAEVAKAVATYTRLFGPVSYPSLAVVESHFFDGLECDGLFFLSRSFYAASDGTLLDDLVDIGVHETAHLWWFGSVGNDQALEPWLDEALATYSERLFYQENYPAVAAWWNFRVDVHHPTGWVDADIYTTRDFRSYANAVYLRGARFLEALRARVGEQAFFSFLRDYFASMSGRRAMAGDFFEILAHHTDADLSDLQAEYFQYAH